MRLRLSVAVALVVSALPALLAQTANGTITGLVSDPAGAVVPNAAIEAKNQDTGAVYTAASTATGNYTVSQLPVGSYELNITVAGFKRYHREGLALAASQVMRIDVPMEIGSTTDSVTVTETVTLLKTENSATVHNVTSAQLQNLPILAVNGGGTSAATNGLRDPYALVRLLPGVSYTASAQMAVNGNPNGTVNTLIEGTTANLTRQAATTTMMVQPSADAVQEVAVLTSNYSAEFGTAGGAVLNVTTKSGTNQFHGTAYDYLVNEALNAAQPYSGLKSKARRNDFGFTFGGPLRIPKLYDGRNKTFFFFSYEGFREHSLINSTSATVPLPAYRTGDFSQLTTLSGTAAGPRAVQVGGQNYVDPLGRTFLSGAIFDPSTTRTVVCDKTAVPNANCTAGSIYQVRDQFPGNRIPASLFDPVALKVLNLVPLPLGPNANAGQPSSNYQNPWPSDMVSHLPSIKLDQTTGNKGHFSLYYQTVRYASPLIFPNGQALGLPQLIDPGRGARSGNDTVRIGYDYTLKPTVLLHFGVGYTAVGIALEPPITDYDAVKELGLRGATVNRLFPNFTTSASTTLGGMTTLGVTQGLSTTASSENRPSANFNLTWVRNSHTIKTGWDWRFEMFPLRQFTGTGGNYTFGANSTQQSALQDQTVSQGTTGFEFASFLMGNVSRVNVSVPSSSRDQKTQMAFFLQDTWKVSRKLTLDYGLRFDYGTYTRERAGRAAVFSPSVTNASAGGHPGGSIFEATCNCSFAKNYPWAFGPRIGIAYQVNSKTVVRGGFGIVYAPTSTAGGNIYVNNDSGNIGFGQWLFQLKDGIPSSITPRWPDFAPNAGTPNNAVGTGPNALDVNAGRPPRQYQWSIGIQRELNRNLVVEASYVANRGVWWGAPNLSTLNLLSDDLLAKYGFTVGNAADSTLLRAQIGNLTPAQRSTLTSRGVTLPWASFPTNLTVRQSLLPFPQYTSLTNAGAPLGKTWYDALQVVVTKRFSRGLSLNANYSFSKNLTSMGVVPATGIANAAQTADVFNRQLTKDLSNTDLPHQFQLSANYTVPQLPNSIPARRILSGIFSGWGMGWYLQYQSGALLALPASTGTDPISNWLGRGPGPAQLVAGTSPFAVNWKDYSGTAHSEPIDINCHCYDPRTTLVLNPAAWQNVPNGQWAANFQSIRSYRGYRYPNENLNFSRNFRIKERVTLQVRAEFQNVFNRMRLPQPTTTGFQSNPTQAGGAYTAGFGVVNPVSGNGITGMRSGTLIGRLTF